MNFKYIKNQFGTKATMELKGDVGEGINGDLVSKEINFLVSNGVTEITQHINTGGGGIINGMSIISTNRSTTAHIITVNHGVCASMGASILASGDTRKAMDFSRAMIHDPLIGGTSLADMEDGKEKNALLSLKGMLVDIFSNVSGKSKDEISELMTAETWMNASEQESFGLVTEVIPTKDKTLLNDITNIDKMVAKASEFKISNQSNINHKSKSMSYKKVLNKLGKDVDTANAEEVVINSIEALEATAKLSKEEAEATKKELATANETITTLEGEKKEATDKAAEVYVDSLIEKGIIEEAKKEEVLVNAKNNLSLTKSLFDSVKPAFVSVVNTIDNKKEDNKEGNEFEGKNFDELTSSVEGNNYFASLPKSEQEKLINEYEN